MGHPACRSLLAFLFIAIPGLTKARRLPSARNKAPSVHDLLGHALSVIESATRRDYVCESSYRTTQLNQYAPIRLRKVLCQ
jgi:hypothetical protein